jgi:hypothetical protein
MVGDLGVERPRARNLLEIHVAEHRPVDDAVLPISPSSLTYGPHIRRDRPIWTSAAKEGAASGLVPPSGRRKVPRLSTRCRTALNMPKFASDSCCDFDCRETACRRNRPRPECTVFRRTLPLPNLN